MIVKTIISFMSLRTMKKWRSLQQKLSLREQQNDKYS